MASNTVHKGWMRLFLWGSINSCNYSSRDYSDSWKDKLTHSHSQTRLTGQENEWQVLTWPRRRRSSRCGRWAGRPCQRAARGRRWGRDTPTGRRTTGCPRWTGTSDGCSLEWRSGREGHSCSPLLVYSMMSSAQCVPLCLCDSLIQRWMWYRKKRPSTWSRARFIFRPAGAPISHCSSSSSSLATCWRTNIRHQQTKSLGCESDLGLLTTHKQSFRSLAFCPFCLTSAFVCVCTILSPEAAADKQQTESKQCCSETFQQEFLHASG